MKKVVGCQAAVFWKNLSHTPLSPFQQIEKCVIKCWMKPYSSGDAVPAIMKRKWYIPAFIKTKYVSL